MVNDSQYIISKISLHDLFSVLTHPPKDLLQTIVLLQALEPSAYVAGIPIWIQRPLFGLLAAVGRALGYKASYNAQPA